MLFTVLCFYDQQTYDINCGLQEKKGFLHAQDSIEWNGHITILTSASLIRDSSCEYKIVENLRVGNSS